MKCGFFFYIMSYWHQFKVAADLAFGRFPLSPCLSQLTIKQLFNISPGPWWWLTGCTSGPVGTLLYGLICEYSGKISRKRSHCRFIKLRWRSQGQGGLALCCYIASLPPSPPHSICMPLLPRQVRQVYHGPVPGCSDPSRLGVASCGVNVTLEMFPVWFVSMCLWLFSPSFFPTHPSCLPCPSLLPPRRWWAARSYGRRRGIVWLSLWCSAFRAGRGVFLQRGWFLGF